MSIDKHIEEHIALGLAWQNAKVYTVGEGGRFADLATALSYIAALSGTDVMTDVTVAGTATTTQNSDAVTGSGTAFTTALRANDYIAISGDGAGFVTGTIYYPLWSVQSATSLRLATGYVGTGGAGKTITVKRPVQYVLLLSPGVHTISSDVSLPNGIALSLVGASRTGTVLNVQGSLQYPRTCRLSIENMTIRSHDLLLDPSTVIGALDAGMGILSLDRLNITHTTNLVFAYMRCAIARINDLRGTCYGAIANILADGIDVTNNHLEVWDGASDVLTLQPYGAFHGTRANIFRGNDFFRHIASISGGGSILEFNQGAFAAPSATKEVRISQTKILDKDQQESSFPGCLQIALTPASIYLDDVVLDNFGDATGRELLIGAAGSSIYANNVRNLDGTLVKLALTAGNYYDLTPGQVKSLTYSTSITPTANGDYFTVVANDGVAFAINAITNAVSGKEYTFDVKNSSGGAMGAITWNAAYLLAGAFTNPADTKRRTITFRYDGTNFVEKSRAAADI